MSNLELKGNMLELIAQVDNRASLEELSLMIKEFVGNHCPTSDFGNELDETEAKRLEAAIEQSENIENLVNHKSVMKRFGK